MLNSCQKKTERPLLALNVPQRRKGFVLGMAWLYLSSGRLQLTESATDERNLPSRLRHELERIEPAELLVDTRSADLLNQITSRWRGAAPCSSARAA
jgi:DNA mismatch repair protein MutS